MHRADNLTTFTCWLSWNLGFSTSWNRLTLNRPEQGLLYLVYVSVGGPKMFIDYYWPAGSKDFRLLQNTQTSFGAHRGAPVSLKRAGRQVTAHFHLVPVAVALIHPLCEGTALLGTCIPPTKIFVTAFDETLVLLNFKVTSWRHVLVDDSRDLKRWAFG